MKRLTNIKFTIDDAYNVSRKLGIDFNKVRFSLDDYLDGCLVELEHGSMYGDKTNVTNDDPILTGKIALVHLEEDPDYYKKLKQIEESVKLFNDKFIRILNR